MDIRFGPPPSNPFQLWTDFNTVQTIAQMRVNYLHNYGQNTGPPTFAVSATDNITFVIQGGGGATVNYYAWIPNKLAGAVAKSQFSESIYQSDNGIGGSITRAGWCCCVTADGNPQSPAVGFNSGYFLLMLSELNQMRLDRIVNSTITTIIAAFGPAPVLGSVVRLEAEYGSGQVTLRVVDDGVTIASFVDNVSPLQTGLPGIFAREFAVGRAFGFKSLRAGVLSRV